MQEKFCITAFQKGTVYERAQRATGKSPLVAVFERDGATVYTCPPAKYATVGEVNHNKGYIPLILCLPLSLKLS